MTPPKILSKIQDPELRERLGPKTAWSEADWDDFIIDRARQRNFPEDWVREYREKQARGDRLRPVGESWIRDYFHMIYGSPRGIARHEKRFEPAEKNLRRIRRAAMAQIAQAEEAYTAAKYAWMFSPAGKP